MKRISYILKVLAVGLLLIPVIGVAEKPVSSNCPCWGSDPGLYEAVLTIEETTCVVSLDYWTSFYKLGAVRVKDWYLRALSPPGNACLQFQTHQGEGNSCVLRVGLTDEDFNCVASSGSDWVVIMGLSDAQIRSCRHALKAAEDYLDATAMCE